MRLLHSRNGRAVATPQPRSAGRPAAPHGARITVQNHDEKSTETD